LSTNFRIAESQPTISLFPCAERLRQAFVGYDTLPHATEKQPLRVYVHGSYDKDRLRLGINEFQTFVNCLPMATVCSEARSHAANFCRAQVGLANLFYDIDAPNDPSDIRDEVSEPIFMQPTTVMVTNVDDREDGPKGFDSGEHLVDVVNRVFGSCVEQIIFSAWFWGLHSLEEIYWPHTAQTQELEYM
jgi:hypothetical protein